MNKQNRKRVTDNREQVFASGEGGRERKEIGEGD